MVETKMIRADLRASGRVTKDNRPCIRLLAQTGGTGPTSHDERGTQEPRTGFFKAAHWTADGTTIVGTTSDNHVDTFIIPPDLLDDRSIPHVLQSYASTVTPEPVDALALYPGFNLQDTATTLALYAVNEQPISLTSVLTSGRVASYPLVNQTTEAYIKPHCITFSPDGSHFLCGSESLISTFDLSRPGQEPVSSFRTGLKNSKSDWKHPAAPMRGIISALAIDQQYNILAAATLTRHISLYDAGGRGQSVGHFAVQGTAADEVIGGHGITQVVWSPCGRYLYIAERKSNGVMFYDIRKTGQLLGWLEDRNAKTNQRLHIGLCAVDRDVDHTIWAGGTDGVVRSWVKPYLYENGISPTTRDKVHDDVVSNAAVHSSGSVLATTSGQRNFEDSCSDRSLKLWRL